MAVVAAAALLLGFSGTLHSARATESVQLPDLVSEPPTAPELEVTSKGATKEESGSKRFLLRFNGYVHNEGAGALDVRGHREKEPTVCCNSKGKPRSAGEIEEEAKKLGVENKPLPTKEAEELATPAMKVEQRVFGPRTPEQESKEAEEKVAPEYSPHEQKPIPGTMLYADADGHHHWHLQHVAKYGLWNAAKTAEVVPSQKVGFCLEDSEDMEAGQGPSLAVYNDEVRGDFCELYRPNATSLTEGISPGWRDRYLKELAWQWVDVSNLAPGEYWLGEEVNPEKFIIESNPENKVAYASEKTVIPGFVAEGQPSLSTGFGQSLPITLKAKSFGVSANEAKYEVHTQPAHGTLSGSGEHLTYTPEAGFSGTDSFGFWVRTKSSEFPRAPVEATVTITVGPGPPPTLAITSAPSALTAGTAGTITAQVTSTNEAVQWSVSAGSIAGVAPLGRSATFTAPSTVPPEGGVTVTAQLAGKPSVKASTTIAIWAAPAQTPAEDIPSAGGGNPGTGGVAGQTTSKTSDLTRPTAMVDGKQLVMSTVAGLAGRVQLLARSGHHVIGACKAETLAKHRFTCHVHLRSAKVAHEKISVVASLRVGSRLLVAVLPAEHIPRLGMTHAGNLPGGARIASASGSILWCSPGTMEEMLVAGD